MEKNARCVKSLAVVTRRARESVRPHGTLARFCIENALAMLRMNLFYRKPRSFATTRRHSFSATDGCTSPSVRLSPSAVCRLRVAFRELAFSKSEFRGRLKFRFFTCFSSVACAVSCTKPHSRRAERFLAFSHVSWPFSPNRACQILFTPHAPFRSVEICKRFACESLSPFQKTIFRPILKHFRHALQFSTFAL